MAGITVTVRTDELEEARLRINQLIEHVETEDNLRPEEARTALNLIHLELDQWQRHLNAVAND